MWYSGGFFSPFNIDKFTPSSVYFCSVEDKQHVANMTCIPRYIPEVTIGAHEFDKSYYSFKSVRVPRTSAARAVTVCM